MGAVLLFVQAIISTGVFLVALGAWSDMGPVLGCIAGWSIFAFLMSASEEFG